jgi:hypothetical protein
VLGEDDKKDAVLYFQWIHAVVGHRLTGGCLIYYVRQGVREKNSCDRVILKMFRLQGRI